MNYYGTKKIYPKRNGIDESLGLVFFDVENRMQSIIRKDFQIACNLTFKETLGVLREQEPITLGVPFPRGFVQIQGDIEVEDDSGQSISTQSSVLERWTDGSVKWAVLDFFVSIGENGSKIYKVRKKEHSIQNNNREILVCQRGDHIEVNNGKCLFTLDLKRLHPFTAVIGQDCIPIDIEGSRIVLRDELGNEYGPLIENTEIETKGAIRATIRFDGVFIPRNREGRNRVCDFSSRLSFFAGHDFVKMEFTVRNPKAAKHSGGMWDLGDRGSIFFKDLSIKTRIGLTEDIQVWWKAETDSRWERSGSGSLEIYQDSSGGANWNSTNHMNRFGEVQTSFCGYRVYDKETILFEGSRANPIISLKSRDGCLSAGISGFWQNFPKNLKADSNDLSIGLFPGRCKDLYELQGGEQKTHTVFLSYGGRNEDGKRLEWIHDPLIPVVDPEYISKTGVFPYLAPQERDHNDQYQALMSGVISGNASFFARREIIDEYGWRNFGDLYADHEALYYKGGLLPVSHYNNQYDPIFGAILQYARNGTREWFQLARDIASHVIDIDIYHTHSDKSAFNGGLFWHTDHYTDAATATHRTYSKKAKQTKKLKRYGGGPSNEHLYTTGLLYFHYLTGNMQAREMVIGLGNWVLAMEDGSRTPFRLLSRAKTGLASMTREVDYHGPGRGAGNSINALIDAFVATKDRKYLNFSEELIRRCIHPDDEIADLNLMDHEARWSYTAFLQSLGKYLDLKIDLAEQDFMFCYARESLLHYAAWMLKNEVPFSQCLDRVEYPTETWIVHDLRKSNVLEFAAKYAEEGSRELFLQKARFFFDGCFKDLQLFESKTLTRPLVMLMCFGVMHSYFQNHSGIWVECRPHKHDFGKPQNFKPQRSIAIARAKAISAIVISLTVVLLIKFILF